MWYLMYRSVTSVMQSILTIYCDASRYSIESILMKHIEKGDEVSIEFMSRKYIQVSNYMLLRVPHSYLLTLLSWSALLYMTRN